MLATIGKKLAWLNGQTFAHLPIGWSILYQLAQLERTVFEKLLGDGDIHPKLTLREAKELVARFNGRRCKKKPGINVKHRLHQFCDFVERTLNQWKPHDRNLTKQILTGLIGQIDEACLKAAARNLDYPLKIGPSHRPRMLPALTSKPIHQTQGGL